LQHELPGVVARPGEELEGAGVAPEQRAAAQGARARVDEGVEERGGRGRGPALPNAAGDGDSSRCSKAAVERSVTPRRSASCSAASAARSTCRPNRSPGESTGGIIAGIAGGVAGSSMVAQTGPANAGASSP
jgi:hypothetical protein